MIRVGIGTDFHFFGSTGKLKLGGIEFKDIPRLQGHSDGDALLHAICDACLGGAGREDIGVLYPDTDPGIRGIDSRQIARKVASELDGLGFEIRNIDAVVEGRRPNIARNRKELRRSIAGIFHVPEDCVNVKGKTNEGSGPEGEGKAIRVLAVVLLKKRA